MNLIHKRIYNIDRQTITRFTVNVSKLFISLNLILFFNLQQLNNALHNNTLLPNKNQNTQPN